MNRIYKLIWSKVKNCYVVASELAKSYTKGCSGKRAGRLLVAGAVAAGLMLPMGEAGAFSSSYVGYNNGGNNNFYSGPDYMTDGGHIDIDQIGGYYDQNGSWSPWVFVNNDGSIEYNHSENVGRTDISSYVGNVAIGNFAEAGSAANENMVSFNLYNGSSTYVAYETEPETGSYNSVTFNGKTYWYGSNWNSRTYAYNPTYNYGGTVINKDGKYYHQVQQFEPELDGEGNWQYDEHGQPLGKTVTRYAEIGEKIWKINPDNPSGNLLVDYKKVDEYGSPVFDLTAEDIGLDESNPYGYSGGTNNVAVGNKSKTLSHSSVAVGDTSTARGYRSIAIGAQSEAGSENSAGDWDSGVSAVAIGDSAKAYGGTSVAVGSHAQTWSFSGIAVGNGSNAGTEYAIALGDGANVAYINGAGDIEQQRTAAQSIAIGRNALAQAKDVTAVGRNAQGMMRNATAYGNNAHANGWNSIAIGNKATAGLQAYIVNDDGTAKDGTIGNSAVAIGNRARAEAEYTTAIGAGTWAEGWHAVAVGDSNRATGRFSTAIGAGWSINHTEGEPDSDDATDGSDAINTEGNRTYDSFGANQAGGDYSSAVGYGNMTVGTQSNAFGKENKVSGLSSLGVGSGNEVGTVAVGDNNVLSETQTNTVSGYAVGSYNKITGSEGTNAGAFGANNTVAGDNGYAVGNSNTVEGENSIAIGTGHTVTGKNSGAIGDPDTIKADSSYVVGNNSKIEKKEAAGSFVIGNDAEAKVGKSVALGSESHAYRNANNGDAGAGFDVRTGKSYTGVTEANKATWVSTLGAVSVGGAEGDSDAAIGSAATATRQITGVAAGTADTDAVNVAQLKLALGGGGGGVIYTAGDNIEITEDNVINATDTTYIIDSEPGGDNTNIVNNYTMTGTNGDKYTFQDTDTTYKFETDRKKKGTVAATFTVTDSTGKKVGEFQDTHNGLKNDTNKVKYDENGEGSVTITDQDGNTTTITGIRDSGGEALNRLGDQITRMDSKIEKVGAGAAALAGLHPLDFDPDEKWDFAAAVGSYKSEQAVALGAFYRPNEDTMFSIGGTIGNGNNMVNVGVSWKFGQKNRISANRISSAKEIIELRKNQEDVHSFLADAVAGNQLDLSKIQLFPDVEENHWAYDYVATMAGNGVLEGYPDGYFKGNRNMTRYEMAAVLYRLMQNGARLSDRALTEFAPELDRIRVDTITKHKDGTPHIQRVRTIKERVDEKADLSSEKDTKKKKAKIKVAEKPME